MRAIVVAVVGFLSVGCAPPREGRLPAAYIQQVVRGNYDSFRLCYEAGLVRDPDLQGKIVVRFVIGRDGRVQDAKSDGSTLPDEQVVNCVVSKYYGLVFSPPDGGIVTVVYPIMFAPG